ncbi:MAG: LPP20 family lipoprotein [Sideroxydans sp.]|nr:LPP20 family lipoprotein [Sideroxydans sp.]
MKKGLVIGTGVALITILTGCVTAEGPAAGSSANAAPAQQAYDDRCKFPGTQELAPGWVCDEPYPGWDVTAPGSAESTAAGHDFQKQMAMTSGRVALAQQFKVHVANMIKQFAQTTGAAQNETVDKVNASVTMQITEQTLSGSKVLKSVQGPDGKLWVLMGIDSRSVEELTQTAVKSSMKNDQALWQQFQSKKGQDEMAAEIAKQKVIDTPSK